MQTRRSAAASVKDPAKGEIVSEHSDSQMSTEDWQAEQPQPVAHHSGETKTSKLPEVTPTSSTGPKDSGPAVEHLNLAAVGAAEAETSGGSNGVFVKEEGEVIEQAQMDQNEKSVNMETNNRDSNASSNEDRIAEEFISHLESTQGVKSEVGIPPDVNQSINEEPPFSLPTNSASIPEHAPYVPPLPHTSSSSLNASLEQQCPSTPINSNNQYHRGNSTSSVFTIGSALDGSVNSSAFSLSSMDVPMSPMLDHVMEESIDRALHSLEGGKDTNQAESEGLSYLNEQLESNPELNGEGGDNEEASAPGSPPAKLPNLSHFPAAQREELKQMYLAGFRDAKEKVKRKKEEQRRMMQQKPQEQPQYPGGFAPMRHTSSEEELRENFNKAQQQNGGIGAALSSTSVLSTSAPANIMTTRSSSRSNLTPMGVPTPLGHVHHGSLPTGGIAHSLRSHTRQSNASSIPEGNAFYDDEMLQSDDLLDDLLGTSPGSPGDVPVASGATKKSGKARQSHSNPFPRKLFDMMGKEDASVVCWLPKGDAFIVRDNDRFVSDILPRYFRHTKVSFELYASN